MLLVGLQRLRSINVDIGNSSDTKLKSIYAFIYI